MGGNGTEYATLAEVNSLRNLIETIKVEFQDTINNIKMEYNAKLEEKDSQLDKLRTQNMNLSRKLDKAELRIEKQGILIDDLEQFSKQNTVRLYGIEIACNETPADISGEVKDEIKRLSLPIQDIEIDSAHRTGTTYIDDYGHVQQPVLVKFNSWRSRDTFYNARENCLFHMKAVLTQRRLEVLRYAKEQIINNSASKYLDHVYADRHCDLMALTAKGRYLTFNTKEDFDSLVQDIKSDDIFDAIAEDFDDMHPGE